jgi:hypothetical protein
MTKNSSEPQEKMFSLKEIEMRSLRNIQQRNNDSLLDFLSFVALERLAYDVTKNTRFRVGEDNDLYISELEEKKEEEVATA